MEQILQDLLLALILMIGIPFAHPLEFKIIYESGSIGSEDIFFMDYDGHNIKKSFRF